MLDCITVCSRMSLCLRVSLVYGPECKSRRYLPNYEPLASCYWVITLIFHDAAACNNWMVYFTGFSLWSLCNCKSSCTHAFAIRIAAAVWQAMPRWHSNGEKGSCLSTGKVCRDHRAWYHQQRNHPSFSRPDTRRYAAAFVWVQLWLEVLPRFAANTAWLQIRIRFVCWLLKPVGPWRDCWTKGNLYNMSCPLYRSLLRWAESCLAVCVCVCVCVCAEVPLHEYTACKWLQQSVEKEAWTLPTYWLACCRISHGGSGTMWLSNCISFVRLWALSWQGRLCRLAQSADQTC